MVPLSKLFSNRVRNLRTLFHRFIELREIHRLIAVAHRVFGIGMDFYDQSVCAGGDRRGRGVGDQIRVSRSVARIDHHGQVRFVMEIGNRCDRAA